MKVKCCNCGNMFDENDMTTERMYDMVEWWGVKVKMPYIICYCPYCHSEEIENYYGEKE